MGGSSAGGDGEMGLTPRGSCVGFYFFNSEKAGRGMSFGPSLSFGLSPWICSRRGLIPLSQPHSLPCVPCWCGVEPGVSQTPGQVGQLLVGGQRGDPKTALEFVYHPIPMIPCGITPLAWDVGQDSESIANERSSFGPPCPQRLLGFHFEGVIDRTPGCVVDSLSRPAPLPGGQADMTWFSHSL